MTWRRSGRTAVVIGGTGRYEDPWHPFHETTMELARITEASLAGWLVRVAPEVESGLTEQLADAGLLVLNIGNAGPDTPSPDARAALVRYLGAGGGLVAVHATSTAFPDWPEWETLLGGRWVRGTTFHPPKAETLVGTAAAHAITQGETDFEVDDEMYSELRVAPDSLVLLTHQATGQREPLLWIREIGGSRVVYVALGHDLDAYAAEPLRRILRRALQWAADASPESDPDQGGSSASIVIGREN